MTEFDFNLDNGESSDKGMGMMKLPLTVPSIIFICFFLVISIWEVQMGSPNVLSTPKLLFVIMYTMIIYYFGGTENNAPGAWVLLITYVICYLTVTIVSTSCARYNTKQLIDLRDAGLLSPFVLDKKTLDRIKSKKSRNQNSTSVWEYVGGYLYDDDDDDDDATLDELKAQLLETEA